MSDEQVSADRVQEAERRKLADRAALEKIVGRPLSSEPWPPTALPLGTLVRVVQDPAWAGPWQREFLGVIDDTAAPELVSSPLARPGEFAYFVRFLEPQFDGDGDGPYRKAHIWGRYLRVEGN